MSDDGITLEMLKMLRKYAEEFKGGLADREFVSTIDRFTKYVAVRSGFEKYDEREKA